MPNLSRFFGLPFLFCVFIGPAFAQQPDTVRIGAYINDIFDINLSEQRFSAQFWVWFNYKNPELKPLETLEIPNAKNLEASNDFTEEKSGVQWAGKRINAVLKKEWDIRRFPFDVQKMTVELEESNEDIQSMVYLADTDNTKLDPQLSLSNWQIERFEMKSGSKQYNTTYGDPELSQGSAYAHAELNIYIKRKTLGLFFSLFTGMYVAFFISWLVFFIAPNFVDPRFGLSVGGLFASVGNKYIVDSILPHSTTFTLVDMLHVATYVSLLLCIIFSVYSLRLWNSGKQAESARFDRRAGRAILILYVLVNLVLIGGAKWG
jgi:hypothetical protein